MARHGDCLKACEPVTDCHHRLASDLCALCSLDAVSPGRWAPRSLISAGVWSLPTIDHQFDPQAGEIVLMPDSLLWTGWKRLQIEWISPRGPWMVGLALLMTGEGSIANGWYPCLRQAEGELRPSGKRPQARAIYSVEQHKLTVRLGLTGPLHSPWWVEPDAATGGVILEGSLPVSEWLLHARAERIAGSDGHRYVVPPAPEVHLTVALSAEKLKE